MTRPDRYSNGESDLTIPNRFGFLNRTPSRNGSLKQRTPPNDNDSSEAHSNGTKTLPRPSKFGRLLRRSMSVIQTSTQPRKTARKPLSADTDTAMPRCDIDVVISTVGESSSETGGEHSPETDDDQITNAFVFNATPKICTKEPLSRTTSLSQPSAEKSTVKAVKVSRVHSQKSPHIRYAATKLSSGDHKDLSSGKKKSPQVLRLAVQRRNSCPTIKSPTKARQGKSLLLHFHKGVRTVC